MADDRVCAASRSPGDLKGLSVSFLEVAVGGGGGEGGTGRPGSCQLASSSCLKSIELDQSNDLSSSASKFETSNGISDISNILPLSEGVSPILSLLGAALSICPKSLGAKISAWLQGQVTGWVPSGAVAPGSQFPTVQDFVAILVACCRSTGEEEVRALGGGSGSGFSDMLDANGLERSGVLSFEI